MPFPRKTLLSIVATYRLLLSKRVLLLQERVCTASIWIGIEVVNVKRRNHRPQ